MKKTKLLKIVVGMLAVSTFASAHDWYTGVSGGATFTSGKLKDKTDANESSAKLKSSPTFGVYLGHYFDENWRTELAFNQQSGSWKQLEKATDKIGGKFVSRSFMVNGYYDFNVYENVSIYLGAGLGYARNSLSFLGESNSWGAFAYNFMLGTSWQANDDWSLSLGYRLYSTTISNIKIKGQTKKQSMAPPVFHAIEMRLTYSW